MRIQLDTPNPALPPEALDEINTNNVKALSQTINKTAAQILLEYTKTDPFISPSTTPVLLTGTDKVFVSSGGLVEVMLQVCSYNPGGGATTYFQLEIDGAIVKKCALSLIFRGQINLVHKQKLEAGRHTVAVRVYVNAGQAEIGEAEWPTYLTVTEWLL